MNPKRKPLIAGNWKMYKTPSEASAFAELLTESIPAYTDREILVCPPFVSIPSVSKVIRGTHIMLGAQNVYPALEGAFTGEVSPVMLKDAGVTHVICGHSERRRLFGESNKQVCAKVRAVLEEQMTAVMCIGETGTERDRGATFQVLKQQLEEGLCGFNSENVPSIIIAYEPVWAIGTGKVATPQQAQEAHAFIRKLVSDRFGAPTAEQVKILYGGSVNPENIDALMACPDIDGALVGGASLKADSFAKIAGFALP
jgi:triosephosphate isomerase